MDRRLSRDRDLRCDRRTLGMNKLTLGMERFLEFDRFLDRRRSSTDRLRFRLLDRLRLWDRLRLRDLFRLPDRRRLRDPFRLRDRERFLLRDRLRSANTIFRSIQHGL